jgi:hypothetical protein
MSIEAPSRATEVPSSAKEFIQAFGRDFAPFAYWDKHLDCIRVQIRDCSVTEERLNRFFTVLVPNHADTAHYVGFTVKGVRHLFEEVKLPLAGLVPLVEILDRIMKIYPDMAVKSVIEAVQRERVLQSLQVDFAKAA